MTDKTNVIDPSQEPEDTVVEGTTATLTPAEKKAAKKLAADKEKADKAAVKKAEGEKEAAEANRKAKVVEVLSQLIMSVSESTPSKYPDGMYISTRIHDTGNTLTLAQAVTHKRLSDLLVSTNAPCQTRNGPVPCHRHTHIMKALLDTVGQALVLADEAKADEPITLSS